MISKYYKKYMLFCIINCVTALLAGTLLYALGRTDIFSGTPYLLKLTFKTLSFYLPDALWAYALFFALSVINDGITSSVLTFISGLCWEILQKFDIAKGTFDYMDICMYLVAILIAIIIIKYWRKKNEKHLI